MKVDDENEHMNCGGKGTLDRSIPFHYMKLTREPPGGKKRVLANLIFPEELPWITELLHAIMYHSYSGKRVPFFFIFPTRNKVGRDIIGSSYPTETHIIITFTPKVFGRLKLCNPHKHFSPAVMMLTDVIWHELHHWKFNRGPKFLDDDTRDAIIDDFWGIMDERSDN